MPATIGTALYVGVLAALYVAFGVVDAPYMDEPFHVGQTQAYCAGRFDEWDDQITTFPGLYAFGTAAAWLRASAGGLSVSGACELPTLRAFNLLPALATPYLLRQLFAALHPELEATAPSDLLANAAVLSLLPTHFFFHFLYYTDSAATCSALLVLLLSLRAHNSLPPGKSASPPPPVMQRLGVGIAAALSIAFRQTNAVWVAFAVASSALRQLHAERRLDLHAGLRQALLTDLPSLLPAALPRLLWSHALPLMLLVGFATFVVLNRGVVVGHRAHHAPALHSAMMLYLTVLAAGPSHSKP